MKIDKKCDKILNMIENIFFEKEKSKSEILNFSPLSLAFLGDGVWTLLIREYLCIHSTYKNTNLHRITTKFVKATYQAKLLDALFDSLSEEEQDVARRARNTKVATIAKNASLVEYKKATSFEAILGYLYLTKRFSRIKEIFEKIKSEIEESIKAGKK